MTQALRSLSITKSEQAFRDASKAFESLNLSSGLTLEQIVSAVEEIRGCRIRINRQIAWHRHLRSLGSWKETGMGVSSSDSLGVAAAAIHPS